MQLLDTLKDKKILTAIGMMSGTSMDGIDLALIKSDGEGVVERGPSMEIAYSTHTKSNIEQALIDAQAVTTREQRIGIMDALENELTDLHADAIEQFLTKINLDRAEIDLIGFHGQTVLHRPNDGITVQLGNGEALAKQTGISVVYDMRANDMKHGGQGAPLVPIYHKALASSLPDALKAKAPIAFVNIGGISNITYVGRVNEDGEDKLVAFDTGPGNALIDQWVQANSNHTIDKDGELASKGRVIPMITKQYLAESYFQQTLPKSLDRLDFQPLQNLVEKDFISLEDGARTLCYVTAASIVKSVDLLPEPPKLWIICGGGRKHPSIMEDLKTLTSYQGGEVISAEEASLEGEPLNGAPLNGDSMEAEAWAYLAIRSVKDLPLTYPMTTGCEKVVSGGVVA